MLRSPLQVFTRLRGRAISSQRNIHADPMPSSMTASSSSSPLDHCNPPADINKIHLDMFFERALLPRTRFQFRKDGFSRGSTTSALVVTPTPPRTNEDDITPRDTRHFFDTHLQMGQLQSCGKFSRQQARVVMETLQSLLRRSLCERKDTLLTRSQLENETYLIGAAVAEFRREVQLLRRTDAALLQSELTALAREVERLEQQVGEDLGSLRSDIELTMNDFRSDVREEQKLTEHQIQGINNRFTVSMGDAATELESLKWSIIWRGLLGGVSAALGIATIGYLLSLLRARVARRPTERKDLESDLSYADMEIY
ncbi:hypothetical protein BX666DRAFT_721319 [Dichotomocladium elegans]|nr:hypothetical protein BX666DRAFT_721319 [Dichotomocladium elegans]